MSEQAPNDDLRPDQQVALANFSSARAFIEQVREAQRASGVSLKGGNAKHTFDSAIPIIVQSLSETYKLPTQILKRLMERFEDMAQRRKTPVPEALQPAIYKILAIEFAANTEYFHASETEMQKLIGATIAHGCINDLHDRRVGNQPNEITYGDFFAETPSTLKYVVLGSPYRMLERLDEIVENTRTLPKRHIEDNANDLTYEQFYKDTPYVIRQTAQKDLDPASNLDEMVRIERTLPGKHIKNDPALPTYGEYFADNPGVIRQEIVEGPEKADKRLDTIVDLLDSLPGKHIDDDPSKPTYREYFGDDAAIFIRAASSNPKKPTQLLDRAVNKLGPLSKAHIQNDPSNMTYGQFFSKSLLAYAVVHHISDPETFLDRTAERVQVLPGKHINADSTKPTYGTYFGRQHSIFKVAASRYTDDADVVAFLDAAAQSLETLPSTHIKENPSRPTFKEFFSEDPWIIKQAVTKYASNAEKVLNRVVEKAKELPKKHIANNPSNPTYGEFFDDMPWIFRRVAYTHRKSEIFLDTCVEQIKKQLANDEKPGRHLIKAVVKNLDGVRSQEIEETGGPSL